MKSSGTVINIVAFIVFLRLLNKQNLENLRKLTERKENHKTSQLPSKIFDRLLNSFKTLARSWLPRFKNNLSALSPISFGFYNSLRCQPWSTESLNLAAQKVAEECGEARAWKTWWAGRMFEMSCRASANLECLTCACDSPVFLLKTQREK